MYSAKTMWRDSMDWTINPTPSLSLHQNLACIVQFMSSVKTSPDGGRHSRRNECAPDTGLAALISSENNKETCQEERSWRSVAKNTLKPLLMWARLSKPEGRTAHSTMTTFPFANADGGKLEPLRRLPQPALTWKSLQQDCFHTSFLIWQQVKVLEIVQNWVPRWALKLGTRKPGCHSKFILKYNIYHETNYSGNPF